MSTKASVYTCPHCGEKSFTPITKLSCGSMRSKGRACPACGRRCVNGRQSTLFRTILGAVMLIFILYQYFMVEDCTVPMLIAIGSYLIVSSAADMVFFPLEKAIRLDSDS